MNKGIQWLINIVAGIFFFFVFLVMVFPLETIVNYYLAQVPKITKGQYQIKVKEVDPHFFIKSRFSDFEFIETVEGQENILVKIPDLRVGIHFMSLMMGGFKGSFEAGGTKAQGTAEGVIKIASSGESIDVDFDRFNLDMIPVVTQKIKLPLGGLLSGEIDLDIDAKDFGDSDGKIDLDLVNFNLKAGRLSLSQGVDIDIPDTSLSGMVNKGKLKLNIKNRVANIQDFSFPGDDIKVSLSGKLELQKKMESSGLTLNGNFKLSDKIAQALPFLIIIDKQKSEDGSFPISAGGTLDAPTLKVGSFDVIN